MNPTELIALARALVNGIIAGGAAPVSQTELRRAVSCAYYAMFHTLALSNANTLIGASTADQQRWAWQQTYRAADHRPTRNKLSSVSLGGRFPGAVLRFGVVFADIQRARHSADYDPHSEFSATDVSELIDRAETVIANFNQTPDDTRRDLAIHILTNVRSD
ncbi:MAG: hypothetical protein J4G13_13975 [Dehalococcoidia bacterium]|nr:hypothetical protein [Dehalococcoidia bacterium]